MTSAGRERRVCSAESDVAVGRKIYRTVNEQSQELSQILIAMQHFHQDKEEDELGHVGNKESPREIQHLMPKLVFHLPIGMQREYPVLAPDEVVNLRHDVSHHIRYHIVLAGQVHHGPYYQGRNDGIQRTNNDKAGYSRGFFHRIRGERKGGKRGGKKQESSQTILFLTADIIL